MGEERVEARWASVIRGRHGMVLSSPAAKATLNSVKVSQWGMLFELVFCGPRSIADVAAGQYASFAITGEGRVEAWGLNNYGQLGISGGALAVHAPTVVDSLASYHVRAIGAGTHHTLAVTQVGSSTLMVSDMKAPALSGASAMCGL